MHIVLKYKTLSDIICLKKILTALVSVYESNYDKNYLLMILKWYLVTKVVDLFIIKIKCNDE